MVLSSVVAMVRYTLGVDERNFVDRLNSFYTSNMLVALALLVSFKQFGGRPIECLFPDFFTDSWEEYGESLCFAQDNYLVPFHEHVENVPILERRSERLIAYYQWVPFFLLFQAACFRLPSFFWRSLSDYSGIKIREVVKLAGDSNNVKPDVKMANIKQLSAHLQGALRFHRRLFKRHLKPHRICRIFNMPYWPFYVTSIYLITKCMYVVNILLQVYIMNAFMQTEGYSFWGWEAVAKLMTTLSWEETGLFPLVTQCDFSIRVHGNTQGHTVQCVLLINLLNEKIFLFLWFWYIILFVVTLLSFFYWCALMAFKFVNKQFIIRHLEMSDEPFDAVEHSRSVDLFMKNYLRTDGVFILRTLVLHSGVMFGTELLQDLWRSYFGIEDMIKHSDSEANLTMAQIDQSEYENRKNYGRQRKRKHDDYFPSKGKFEEDQQRLIPQPIPVLTPDMLSQMTLPKQNHPSSQTSPPSYSPGLVYFMPTSSATNTLQTMRPHESDQPGHHGAAVPMEGNGAVGSSGGSDV